MAQVVDTNWHDIEVWNDSVNFFVAVDGVQQYTVADSGLATGGAMFIKAVAACGTGATNREVDVDRMYVVTASN